MNKAFSWGAATDFCNDRVKKLAESTGNQVQQILEMMREKDLSTERRRRDGMKLGGLIVSAVGLGLTAMLALLVPQEPVWSVGLIPLFIGAALLVYAFKVALRLPAAGKAEQGSLS